MKHRLPLLPKHQVVRHASIFLKSKTMKMVLLIISALSVCLVTYAQSRNVNGRVLNQEMEPLWYIGIYINDWVKVGETDSNGKYEITIPSGVDSIIFRGVGYEPLLVKLNSGCSRIEAIMVLAGSYDFMSPAKVDRKRRRYFDKISKLYPVAVEKGLFSSGTPCSKVIFQPDAPRMKEMHKQRVLQEHSAQHQLSKTKAFQH